MHADEVPDELRFVAERGSERFEIIEGRGEVFYLFRYLDGRNTHDYFQPSIAMARLAAEEMWSVQQSAWREATNRELPYWKQSLRL